jgi:putative transposase
MPEHVHLLLGEPKSGNPSTVIHSLKLRVSKRMRRGPRFHKPTRESRFWQPRFYDFNVHSADKRREKLDYMHRNPVARELVTDPADWIWSSYPSYSGRGTPLVEIDFVD